MEWRQIKKKKKKKPCLDSSAMNYPPLQSNSDYLRVFSEWLSERLEAGVGLGDRLKTKTSDVTAFVKAPWRNDTDALSLEICHVYT